MSDVKWRPERTEQRVEPLSHGAGRVKLVINGRQQLLPVLHCDDVEDVQKVCVHKGDVSAAQLSICKIFKKVFSDVNFVKLLRSICVE